MTESGDIIVIEPSGQPDMVAARDSIRKLLDEGVTVQTIAARLNLDPEKVLAISDEQRALQRQTIDNGQRLVDHLEKLEDICDIAYWQCKADPHPNHIYAYTAALEIVRGIMQDIDGRRDNDKLTEDLVKKVLEPLVSDTLISMTQILAKFKGELSTILPAEQHAIVTLQVEGMLRSLASILGDQLTGSKDAIQRVLNDVKADTSKPQPSKRPKPAGR